MELRSIELKFINGQYELSCNGITLLYGDEAVKYMEKLYTNNPDVKQLVDASEEIIWMSL